MPRTRPGVDFYIQDMLGFGENVLSFTDGLDKEAFVADMRT